MEDMKYHVNKEDIYVGEVVRANRIYRCKGGPIFGSISGELTVSSYFPYRSILFVPNEKNFSNDLLYRSPSYPILNLTDEDTCLNLGKKSIVIKDACNLASLLEYFGYGEALTYEDIVRIRKTFFTGKFAMDHCELFGWKETMAEDVTFYANGKEVTDPKELEQRRKEFRAMRKAGHRSFHGISESILPREYFHVLDTRGNHTLMDVIQWHEKMDAFAPHKQEGPIKKLTRF